ncbi:putative cyclin-dependent protein kinase inhibitor SMR [Helianthus annuus]|nr:putative cyclin-dependent protein kinase inhibitor SMR [Helianthus annuus]KAJ0900850.1 putative cyclin-dependent protein kinase inhibitor SMR [Helianthus annuus]
MSADLQLPQQQQHLRPIQSFTLNLPHMEPESCIIQSQECVTPTSPQHRIPPLLICPPPPKKQRRTCKRRSREFQFFEAVAGDEIDAFFKSSFELINRKRRRCDV